MLGLIFTSIILTACSAQLFVPPVGTYFRLKSLRTHKCIHDSNGGEWGPDKFYIYWCGEADQYHDQFFTLVPVNSPADDPAYQIKNKDTNRCMIHSGEGFKMANCDSRWHAQKWRFIESNKNDRKSYFQIKNEWSNKCIFNAAHGFNPYECLENDDQLWQFIIEDSVVTNVDYYMDKKKLTFGTPWVIAEKVCNNIDGQEPEPMKFIASQTVTETSSFSNSLAVGMSASATFSAGIPLANAELEVSVSTEYEHTWGKEESKERTLSVETELLCKLGEKLEQKCSMHHGELTVPYTMTLKTKGTNIEYKMSGEWEGTSAFYIECETKAI